MKKIIMIKSVFDDTEAQKLEESFNPITVALTDALFGEAHPFGSKLRKKVSVEDIAKRRECALHYTRLTKQRKQHKFFLFLWKW